MQYNPALFDYMKMLSLLMMHCDMCVYVCAVENGKSLIYFVSQRECDVMYAVEEEEKIFHKQYHENCFNFK